VTFTDPASGRAIVFGGLRRPLLSGWYLGVQGGRLDELTPATIPGGRAAAAAGLDPVTHRVVMFGGLAGINPYNTWTWTAATVPRISDDAATIVYDASAAYSPQLGGVTLFGGADAGTALNDTWLWNGADWRSIRTGRSPSPRESFGMAYDEQLGTIVVFGGQKVNTLYGTRGSSAASDGLRHPSYR
jgi:hypothetical protein